MVEEIGIRNLNTKIKHDLKIAFSFFLIGIIATTTVVVWVYASPSSSLYLSGGIYPQGSYTIWTEGYDTPYYCKDSHGKIPSWGDGTSDCTDLVVNANSALASEGGTIVFAGDYAQFNFSSGFTLSPKVSLKGQSRQRFPLLSFQQTDSSDCITLVGEHTGTIEVCSILENLQISGSQGTTGNGIVIVPLTFSITIRNVLVAAMGGNGIQIEGYDILIDSSRFNSNNRGIVLKQSGASTTGELIFIDVSTKNNINEGVLMEDYQVSNIVFIGGSHETNGGYGGRFRGCPVNLYGVKFELNTLDQCFWSAYGVIEGCYFIYAPTNKYAIYFGSARETHVMSNRFSSNWKDFMIDSGCRKLYIDSQIGWNDSKIDIDSRAFDCEIWHMNDFRGLSTDANGEVTLDFNFAFTDKPSINVVLETNKFWNVETWYTDDNSRYNGTKLQILDADGTPTTSGITVHAFVTIQ